MKFFTLVALIGFAAAINIMEIPAQCKEGAEGDDCRARAQKLSDQLAEDRKKEKKEESKVTLAQEDDACLGAAVTSGSCIAAAKKLVGGV